VSKETTKRRRRYTNAKLRWEQREKLALRQRSTEEDEKKTKQPNGKRESTPITSHPQMDCEEDETETSAAD